MNTSERIGVETRGRKRARELRDGEGEGDGKGEGEGGGEGEGDMTVVSTVRDVGSVTKGKPRRSKVSTREGAKTSAARCSETRSPPPHLREGRRKGKKKPRGTRPKDARGVRPLEERSGNEAARDVGTWFEKSLRRAAAAKPTRVVSTSEGGRGYKCLVNESVEELQEWGDYDEKDDEQFFANGERLEQQRAEKAAAVTIRRGERRPAAKRARIDGAVPVRATKVSGIVAGEKKKRKASTHGGATTSTSASSSKARKPVRKSGRLCSHHGCGKHASFARAKGERARWCARHKDEGDVNVQALTCEVESCSTRASFAPKGERAKWCARHKHEGDVNVRALTCEVDNCSKQASFAPKGERAKRCARHKHEGDVDVRALTCEFDNCSTRASFAPKGERAKWCARHKHEGDVNVVGPRCQVCETIALVLTVANPKYAVDGADGILERLCAHCFWRRYPQGAYDGDERAGGRTRTKSREGICVAKIVNSDELKDLAWRWDAPFYFGCPDGDCTSRRRVDLWCLIGCAVLGVEIDENQHKTTNYESDHEVRTNEINLSIGIAPFHLIRFNPDAYTSATNKRIKGFYCIENSLVRRRTGEVNRRLDVLLVTLKNKRQELEALAAHPEMDEFVENESYLTETELFFDGYAD